MYTQVWFKSAFAAFALFATPPCILRFMMITSRLPLCLSLVPLYSCPPVALPLQPVSSSLPQSRVTASVPENLSLFLDPAPKAEDGTVKKLSKDSILSLYASTPSVHASSMATHGEIWRTLTLM